MLHVLHLNSMGDTEEQKWGIHNNSRINVSLIWSGTICYLPLFYNKVGGWRNPVFLQMTSSRDFKPMNTRRNQQSTPNIQIQPQRHCCSDSLKSV